MNNQKNNPISYSSLLIKIKNMTDALLNLLEDNVKHLQGNIQSSKKIDYQKYNDTVSSLYRLSTLIKNMVPIEKNTQQETDSDNTLDNLEIDKNIIKQYLSYIEKYTSDNNKRENDAE